jgi:hypothetical protein
MKTVTYWFRKPAMDTARSALVRSTIEALGGEIEDHPEPRNWHARFTIAALVNLDDHRKLVVDELKEHVGVTPIVTRTMVERIGVSPR